MTSFRHIGINAVFLRPRMAGIETYVRCLIPELVALRPDLRITLFLSREGRMTLADEPWLEAVEVATHPLLGLPYLRAASEMTLLGLLADSRGIDVMDSVALTGPLHTRAAHVVTIGDLTWATQRDSVPAATGWIWRTFVPRIARRADRVLTYSEAARRDIVELLAVPAERIDVVALGSGVAEIPTPTPSERLRADHRLEGARIVLAVSGKRPNKNLDALIRAMPAVRERVSDAVVVLPGEHTPYEDELRRLAAQLGVSDCIRFLGYVSAADLESLYREAACFAFPSTHEGFGLPVLEAMRRGAPVACANASSLPEVAGDAALYFDPHRPDEIARTIVSLLEDPGLARRLTEAGELRSREFTWQATAEGTLACFERAWHARERGMGINGNVAQAERSY